MFSDVHKRYVWSQLEESAVMTPHKNFKLDCSENQNIMDREVNDGLKKIYGKTPTWCP